MKGAMVSTMITNKANTLLFTGDSMGFIYAWDINNYCHDTPADAPPECEWNTELWI